jgi:hypothetical protein
MRGRSRDEFYCGTLLGGCGKRLTPKLYTEKKCHFAHRPPVHCRRTANGESSADHLYIGRALAQWLARQNHRKAKASYRTVGRPGGTAPEPGASRLTISVYRLDGDGRRVDVAEPTAYPGAATLPPVSLGWPPCRCPCCRTGHGPRGRQRLQRTTYGRRGHLSRRATGFVHEKRQQMFTMC